MTDTPSVPLKALLDEFVWVDVPPPPRGAGKGPRQLEAIAAELRTRPGEWAIVRRRPNRQGGSLSTAIAKGTSPAFRPPGAYEAVGRSVDGEFAIYARFVGNGA